MEKQRRLTQAPFVVVCLQTTGIHPSTSRVVAIDAVTFTAGGDKIDSMHAVVNPRCDTGPFHMHGLSRAQIAQGVSFTQALGQLCAFTDGRTMIVHNGPRTWGFIVAEAARARKQLDKPARHRRRRRRPPARYPKPVVIVDVLASARRQGVTVTDTRIRGLAAASGVDGPSPVATPGRAKLAEKRFTRESTMLVWRIYRRLAATGDIAAFDPAAVRADRFGLQRSLLRVDANDAERRFLNPGVWTPGTPLVEGMEVVVSPDIRMDPDIIIEAAVTANLSYSEKLTRQTSVVVCNRDNELFGKTLHADRKDIPLVVDEDFVALCESVARGRRS
ncbi:DNA polymerase III subunit epsilon [Corynebacterium sp. CCM 8862]|uniref:DNA polymerase III subunit epsilon n=2 Tax=Corynebacterium mendelii TaxID=2765362 RepID=A0A939E1C9_9CORY|nr:DNA polymerase III subunit epsilon [Corynebacterium mendelii]MBN9643737.1 DNA polymerase III subunit epsilon [Corynebacterium mendelii]